MLLKYFYDDHLAHASYLVGCQKSQTAIIIDPARRIEPYLEMADQHGVKIAAVAETHIHADFVSGARELAERVGAKLYLSDEGPAEWKYEYLDGYDHQLLRQDDSFYVGKVRFDVLHTPGHTPESLSFLLTDEGGGASEPMGIFTGDFVFVGSIGRPDLLEEAAGIANTAEPGARDLYHSIQRFRELPDFLQVWPAHGAGSACGKGLGAVPSSTVGYEKLYNPALQYSQEDEFVRYILDDQPDAPSYFAVMKRVNKEGPRVLGANHHHPLLTIESLPAAVADGNVVDLRPSKAFAESHVPGTLNIPLPLLASWAGWLLDYDKPAWLIAQPDDVETAARILHEIGVERIEGAFPVEEVSQSGLATESYQAGTPEELQPQIASGQLRLIDVRSQHEWDEGHITQAEHYFLGRLPRTCSELDAQATWAVQCRSGARSSIAASVLQAAGIKDVVNLTGGITAWNKANLPTVSESSPSAEAAQS